MSQSQSTRKQSTQSTRQPKPRLSKGYRNQPSTRCSLQFTGSDLNAARHKAEKFIDEAFVSCGKLDSDPGRRPRIARVCHQWTTKGDVLEAVAIVTWKGRF